MRFMLIDYTAGHTGTDTGQTERGGKFIQLTDGEEECLVFSTGRRHPFHANIAEEFLRSRGRAGRYNHKRDHYFTEGTGWEIVGGGHWRLTMADLTVRLAGASLAYGAFKRRGLKKKIETSGAFPGYRVVVEQ
jgi:hypothetical protein